MFCYLHILMKYLNLSLTFLILLSCNNINKSTSVNQDDVITKSENQASVKEMWNNYTTANLKKTTIELPESWFFHNNKADANRLGKLVAEGKKQAGSGLYVWYEEAGAPLPAVGTKHIITDFDGKALAIIETKKVDTIAFNNITLAYAALDMGTDEEPLKKWKKAHRDFFTMALAESNDSFSEEMLVVCEYFETIWPVSNITVMPNALSLTLQPAYYALSTLPETIEITMHNTTRDTVTTGLHYTIEQFTNNNWETVSPDLIFNDIGYELLPNSSKSFSIPLLKEEIIYSAGSYRISKNSLKNDYHKTRKRYPVLANFTIY